MSDSELMIAVVEVCMGMGVPTGMNSHGIPTGMRIGFE